MRKENFKKVIIAGDYRGDKIKPFILECLKALKIKGEIIESNNENYVDATKRVVSRLKNDEACVLVCGTGIGVMMVANKFRGVRACLATNEETAYYARRHEDANCLCLPAGYNDGTVKLNMTKAKIEKIIRAFFTTDFEGGRHIERLSVLNKLGE